MTKASSSETLSSIVCKIFMALFAHSSYALRQLELFNVPRNVDFNLRASLRSQLGCDWLVVSSDVYTVKIVPAVKVKTMKGH
jgi:hypothetical protein